MVKPFYYRSAFSRNIGWVTETEQEVLRTKRIAIAGLGGVGGSHLLAFTRLGVGKFNISDLDVFELANFNRQAETEGTDNAATHADTMHCAEQTQQKCRGIGYWIIHMK